MMKGTRCMENFVWQVISQCEFKMAQEVAETLISQNLSIEEYVDIIMNIEKHIPEHCVDLNKPFSDHDECASNNIVSQIAYSLSEKLLLNDGNGVVLTSNILAEDMVRMSIIEWMSSNLNISREATANYVYGATNFTYEDAEKIREYLPRLTWYDPCVGGGVFPLAIIKIYRTLGISSAPQIYGNDLNPLFVAATRKRMELACGSNCNENILCRDALDCNLQQRDIFNWSMSEQQYDIVIGNPPYVKAGKIERNAKKKYEENYPEIVNKGADLYTYFISHSLNALKDNGILTFVTPAQFQMSNYGKSIRTVIEEKGDLCAVADFNELPVFKNIGIHTSVYAIKKAKNGRDFIRYEYDSLPKKEPFEILYSNGMLFPQRNISAKGWFFSSANTYMVLEYLESVGVPLIEYSGEVLSGIKSSCKAAFFLKEADIAQFDDCDLDKCRRMLLPKKIKKWRSIWEDDYMVVVKKDELLDESSKLYAHMEKHRDELSARSDVVGHKTWYGLRPCGYYEKFDMPKIIYPDIATECRFSMDKDSRYIPDGAFFIPSEDYYLLGILNSCVGRYYFRQKCARIGNPMKGGRIRFKKVYIENFPVVPQTNNPDVASKIRNIAMHAVDKGFLSEEQERILDKYAIMMYQISDDMKISIMEA